MSSHPLSTIQSISSLPLESDDLLSSVISQESIARFTSFSHTIAWQIGSTIREIFLSRYDPTTTGIVIRIELWDGQEIFGATVGNSPAVGANNWVWVKAKSNIVKKYGKSSLRMGREIAKKGKTPEEMGLHFPEYACHGGGFPIFIRGVDSGPIGAIMVSGLVQLEDHQLIVDALTKCSEFFEPGK